MSVTFRLAEDGRRVLVRAPYSQILVHRARNVPGRVWNPDTKEWSFPTIKDVLLMVCDVYGVLPEMLPHDIKEILDFQGYSPPVQEVPNMGAIEGHAWLTTPYDHQKVNLARLMQFKRWLIADEQGCGKSMVVANRIFRLLLENYNNRVLILCPKSVVSVWEAELMKHAGLSCDIIEGKPQHQRALLGGHRNIKVANYEKLLHSFNDFQKNIFHCLVLDECHRAKNFTTQTSKAVRVLSKQANYVWALSGTPAPNGLEDWLGVLEAVAPGLLPCKGARGETTKGAFEERYCLKEANPNGGFRIAGYRNVHELHGYVASLTSRYTKAQCLDLPPKVYSARRVHLAGEQARIYKDLKRDAVARIKGQKKEGVLTVRNILTESLRLLQVAGGFVPTDEGVLCELDEKAKWPALQEVLEEIGDRQVVIWCKFVAEARWLAEKLKAIGEVGLLIGASTETERRNIIDDFQHGNLRFFIGTSAGGTGITLHAADTEIFYSRDYNLGNYLQMTDRLHRIGQTRSVSIIKLIAENTVDVSVDDKLERKAELQEMLLQSPKEYL
jgi:SNF2 family DNA or RNA helicase